MLQTSKTEVNHNYTNRAEFLNPFRREEIDQNELVTHPGGGVEFSQQEEDILLARFKRLVLTAAVAVVGSHGEARGQLPEAGCDVGFPLVQLSQLTA